MCFSPAMFVQDALLGETMAERTLVARTNADDLKKQFDDLKERVKSAYAEKSSELQEAMEMRRRMTELVILRTLNRENRNVEQAIHRIRSDSRYRSEDDCNRLTEDVRNLESLQQELDGNSETDTPLDEDNSSNLRQALACKVCLVPARPSASPKPRIFECRRCFNFVCVSCKDRLMRMPNPHCAFCREPLLFHGQEQLVRAELVERLLDDVCLKNNQQEE